MKHKVLLLVTIFLSLALLAGCNFACMQLECENKHIEGSKYCEQHTCLEDGCTSLATVENYCQKHLPNRFKQCIEESCTNNRNIWNDFCVEHEICSSSGCTEKRHCESAYCSEHKCDYSLCNEPSVIGDNTCVKHGGETPAETMENPVNRISSTASQSTISYPDSLTDDQKLVLWIDAENAIEARLKSPSTAKFPSGLNADGVTFHYNNQTGLASIWGWVDAQNSYGATIREEWLVDFKVSEDGERYELTNVEFF